ncbi:Helix-turn-helix domain-containing protein [Paenibacillus algorifonticola]|uniref:Helix-turn-helix domain-containing protein n=1 Tax=Paenibacillus algorifonticola TaxID=684063 RepID=A0A1I2I6M2_9BACL|nr:AraC family transcriptional regulator [Paenibacillus algorifonticola]SFF37975.1 Helix-turn-helix domain-containing protein [Paenibacillus algorifonticola]
MIKHMRNSIRMGFQEEDTHFRQNTESVAGGRSKLGQTVEYMKRHYQKPITRDMLASMVGITPEHYSRAFKKHMGISPIDYLIAIRIDRAKGLLKETNATVRSIARQVGYEDPYYFSRRFKQEVGVAPSAYAVPGYSSGL